MKLNEKSAGTKPGILLELRKFNFKSIFLVLIKSVNNTHSKKYSLLSKVNSCTEVCYIVFIVLVLKILLPIDYFWSF